MSRDQSKQNRPIVSKGGDKMIQKPKSASKGTFGGDNKRKVSSSGGMEPSTGCLGGYPDGV